MNDDSIKISGTGLDITGAAPPQNTINFFCGTVEVMRLSRDGVWVNPDIKPDEAAQVALNALTPPPSGAGHDND